MISPYRREEIFSCVSSTTAHKLQRSKDGRVVQTFHLRPYLTLVFSSFVVEDPVDLLDNDIFENEMALLTDMLLGEVLPDNIEP